jgi:hypothetical protein
MPTTFVTKRQAIKLVTLQDRTPIRKRPTLARLNAMRIVAELEIDLSGPLGEFAIEVLELAPRLPDPQLGGEYDNWLDDVDSSRFDTPDDYNLSHVGFDADCQV